ncbi:MAG: helix-turn-helix domain-containing protein [Planctomycetota bacterium]|nr:helix-turn-helix domain-containing protein [Planctomycetota bacterium]NRA76254.1 helix-turn-helix domain-containing protein [Planctomycetota bacterium]
METGRKIMNLRKDRGVAQKSLAQMTSVTPSALSRIEAGIHQPRGTVALRIARELGVTVDYILDETAPYPPPAKVLLKNLSQDNVQEPRDHNMKISSTEKRLLKSLRDLSSDERKLLARCLEANNKEVRLALFALSRGEKLGQLDEGEINKFQKSLDRL